MREEKETERREVWERKLKRDKRKRWGEGEGVNESKRLKGWGMAEPRREAGKGYIVAQPQHAQKSIIDHCPILPDSIYKIACLVLVIVVIHSLELLLNFPLCQWPKSLKREQSPFD